MKADQEEGIEAGDMAAPMHPFAPTAPLPILDVRGLPAMPVIFSPSVGLPAARAEQFQPVAPPHTELGRSASPARAARPALPIGRLRCSGSECDRSLIMPEILPLDPDVGCTCCRSRSFLPLFSPPAVARPRLSTRGRSPRRSHRTQSQRLAARWGLHVSSELGNLHMQELQGSLPVRAGSSARRWCIRDICRRKGGCVHTAQADPTNLLWSSG
jgi:hypothetical protein